MFRDPGLRALTIWSCEAGLTGMKQTVSTQGYQRHLARSVLSVYLTSVLPLEMSMNAREQVTTIVSTKGQVILPKAIRELRQWSTGTQLIVENTPDGVLLKSAAVFPKTDLDAVFGALRYSGPALSIDDMNVAITTEARRRARD